MRVRGSLMNMLAVLAVVMPLQVPSCGPPDVAVVRVEFYRAGGYRFSWRERRAVERIAEAAVTDARRFLPGLPGQILVKVRAGANVIPETGELSNAFTPNVVWWDVNPRHAGGVRATAERELRASLFHAFTHLVRNNAHRSKGLTEEFIGEGLAIAFERDFARVSRPWGDYSGTDETRVRDVLGMPDEQAWGAWLRADRQGRR